MALRCALRTRVRARPLAVRGLAVLVIASVVAGAWGGLGSASPRSPSSEPPPQLAAVAPEAGSLVAGALAPAAPKIDPGQWLDLTADATGGVPPYTYQWLSGTFPECSADSPLGLPSSSDQLNVSSSTGSQYYCYNVTDSETPNRVTVSSATDLVAVNATALTAGSITPAAPTIDLGNSVRLVSDVYGGAAPYTIDWFTSGTSPGSCELSKIEPTGASAVVSPANTAEFCYNVTDSSVGTPRPDLYSAAVTVTVDPALAPGTVSPSTPTIDHGQTVVLSASPSGGTGAGTYTVQWYAGTATSCSSTSTKVGTNSTTYGASPTANTSFCYAVTDTSAGSQPAVSPADEVLVSAALAASAPTGASTGIDPGQTVELTAHPTGGTKPYSFVWYEGSYSTCSLSGDSAIAGQTNRTLNVTLAAGESAYYCYAVTDSAISAATSFSATELVTVNSALIAGPASPQGPIIDLGRSVALTAAPGGGTPTYHYSWTSGTDPACSGDTTSVGSTESITVAPSNTTFYCYTLSDSSPGSPPSSVQSSADEVTVDSSLVAGSPSPAAPTIDGGTSVTLTANPSGGTPVYSYQWFSGTPSACSTTIPHATNATYVASPKANTSYCYSVSDGSDNPPTLHSAVDSVIVLPALTAAFASTNQSIDLGQSVVLTAKPSGGKSPYFYQWYSGSSSTCALDTTRLGSAKTQTISPTASTDYCYTLNDSLTPLQGHVNSTADLVTVNADLQVGTVASNMTVLDLGQSAVLVGSAAHGTAPLHYQWYTGASADCTADTSAVSGGTAAKLSVAPKASGFYCYVVTDSSSGTPAESVNSSTYQLTVNPALLDGGIQSLKPTIDLGGYDVLTANVSGGTPPLVYSWFYSSNATCSPKSTKVVGVTGSTYNVTPRSTTSYCFEVMDASTGIPRGISNSTTYVVTVNVPPPPTFLGLPVVQGYIVLGVLLGVFALIGYAIYRRLKRGRSARGPAGDFL